MSSRQPPIPRGSAAGRVKARPAIPPNIRGRANKNFETRVERLFQSRNELDAFKAVEERNNERERNAEFQERRRQTGLTSKQLAIARKVGRERSEEIRKVNRTKFEINKKLNSSGLNKELNKEAVAGRVFGSGIERVDFANALFGGAGLNQVATKLTEVRARIPEPEPEPEPEFTSAPTQPPPEPIGTDARGRPQPEGVRDNRPMSERSTANFEANAFQPNTAGGGQRLADSVIQNRGTF